MERDGRSADARTQAPPEQKAHFNELARIEKEEHAKK
jgi:hypothetical protein